MSAGPDRIVVSHEVDGWRWSYKSNGRTIAVSSEAYRDRKACLHGLFLVTGIRLQLPHGWRGTNDDAYLDNDRLRTTRVLRERRTDWHGLIASVHDWPGLRKRRAEARARGEVGDNVVVHP